MTPDNVLNNIQIFVYLIFITRKWPAASVTDAKVYPPDRCSFLGKTKFSSRFAYHPNLMKKRLDCVFHSKLLKQVKVNLSTLKMVDLEGGSPR